MIKLEHTVLASPEQMGFIIEGMRNPMDSWEKSDSGICLNTRPCHSCHEDRNNCKKNIDSGFVIGDNDLSLMQRLAKSGSCERKFMRMIPVYVRITAPLYWWKEFDTYKVGTVANSCSTMHKIAEKEFTMKDFSTEHLLDGMFVQKDDEWIDQYENPWFGSNDVLQLTIRLLNYHRVNYLETKDKKFWWQMIQLLPSSYNQTRNVMMNYEVLANVYKWRRNHKLDEWREFCKWIEGLPYCELITGFKNESDSGKGMLSGYSIEKSFPEPFVSVDNGRGTGLWQPGDED